MLVLTPLLEKIILAKLKSQNEERRALTIIQITLHDYIFLNIP